MANLCLSRNAKKLELNLEHRQKRPSIAHWVEFSPTEIWYYLLNLIYRNTGIIFYFLTNQNKCQKSWRLFPQISGKYMSRWFFVGNNCTIVSYLGFHFEQCECPNGPHNQHYYVLLFLKSFLNVHAHLSILG